MDLIDKLNALSVKIEKQLENIQTEEATKTAFVMPFISALGYDVFDPTEVIPEYTADIGIKKGEKVDYAIIKDSKPIMIFECKKAGSLEESHASQLFRYFSVTDARVAILTDGIKYKFFTDLDEDNKMDRKPFLEFNITSFNENIIEQLKKFSKDLFDIEEMLSSAIILRYTKEIKHILAEQFNSPSEDFVRYFVSQIYSGRMTTQVKDQFANLVKNAANQFISEKINERLKSAMSTENIGQATPIDLQEETSNESNPEVESNILKIETTEEELEGYHIVKAILRQHVSPERVVHRDTQSYFGILLDDNNRKPICRLHFNYSTKYIGVFDADKNETRIPINELNDIYNHADKFINIVDIYINKKTELVEI